MSLLLTTMCVYTVGVSLCHGRVFCDDVVTHGDAPSSDALCS